jgi:hypothetical protein
MNNAPTRSHRLFLTALLLAAALALTARAFAFKVVSNRPFGARCNGPLGAMIVRDAGRTVTPRAAEGVSAMSVAAATFSAPTTQAVLQQHSLAMLQRAARPLQLLQSRGVLRKHYPMRPSFPRIMVHTTSTDQIVLPDLVTTMQVGTAAIGDPSNDLHITFEGFDPTVQAAFEDYLHVAMPVAKKVYGPPAFDINVRVIQDANVRDLQGGYYDVTTNELHLAPPIGNLPEDTFVLMKLLLHAFHDDAFVYFDAWEEGMAGTAATAIQTTPGVAPGYLPYDPGPFYCLSVYEAENQPSLGSPSFFSQSSGFSGMLVWRIAMARAAWLKCYIEDPNFFANFNAEYYRRYSPSLAGDTPGLKDVAATVLPMVEGMGFYDWYEAQYVLDTSIRTGPKMFIWNIPLPQSCALILEHYYTDGAGSEIPRGGQAMTIYWAYDFSVSLYAEEGNVLSVPSTGEGAGEGFLIPTFFNIGGAQRITIQVDLNGLRGYYVFPYGERGFDPGTNNLYGGIIDSVDGQIDVSGAASVSNLTVARGVWGKPVMGGNLSPGQITVTFTAGSGDKTSRTCNVGWDSYIFLMRGGGQTTVSVTFPAGVEMICLPIYTLIPSASDLLGVPADKLLLARWDPSLSGSGRYRLWPDIDGFSPGKGYWVKLFADQPVSVKGMLPDPTLDFSVPLQFGWNQIGSPRLADVTLTDLRIQVGTNPSITWTDAVNRHFVQSTLYGYTTATGYVKADALKAFYGYWMRSLVNGEVRLIFPAGIGTTSTAAIRRLK